MDCDTGNVGENEADDFGGDATHHDGVAPDSERELDEQQLEEMALRRTEDDLARMRIVKGSHPAAKQSAIIKGKFKNAAAAKGLKASNEGAVAVKCSNKAVKKTRNIADERKAQRPAKNQAGLDLATQLTPSEKRAQAAAFRKQVGLAVIGLPQKKAQAAEWRLAEQAYRCDDRTMKQPADGWIAGLERRWMVGAGERPLSGHQPHVEKGSGRNSSHKAKALLEFHGRMRRYKAAADKAQRVKAEKE